MCNCCLFDKDIDQREEISSIDQTWEDFITHFQNDEENFNLKKSVHDKKGCIGRPNTVEEVKESELYGSHNYDINKMDT